MILSELIDKSKTDLEKAIVEELMQTLLRVGLQPTPRFRRALERLVNVHLQVGE